MAQGDDGSLSKQSVSDDSKHASIRTLLVELIKLNQPDWLFILVGVVCSALIGCLFPLIAVPFSEVLRVSSERFTQPRLIESLEQDVVYVWWAFYLKCWIWDSFNFSYMDSMILKPLRLVLLECVEDSLLQLWVLFSSILLPWVNQWVSGLNVILDDTYFVHAFNLCRISLSLWLGSDWPRGWGTSASRPCWGRTCLGLTGKLTPLEHYSLGWPPIQRLSKRSGIKHTMSWTSVQLHVPTPLYILNSYILSI